MQQITKNSFGQKFLTNKVFSSGLRRFGWTSFYDKPQWSNNVDFRYYNYDAKSFFSHVIVIYIWVQKEKRFRYKYGFENFLYCVN